MLCLTFVFIFPHLATSSMWVPLIRIYLRVNCFKYSPLLLKVIHVHCRPPQKNLKKENCPLVTFSRGRPRTPAVGQMPGGIPLEQSKHWYLLFQPPEKKTQPKKRRKRSLPIPLPAPPVYASSFPVACSLWTQLCAAIHPSLQTNPSLQVSFPSCSWFNETKVLTPGISLVVPWLGLHAPSTGGRGSIPD